MLRRGGRKGGTEKLEGRANEKQNEKKKIGHRESKDRLKRGKEGEENIHSTFPQSSRQHGKGDGHRSRCVLLHRSRGSLFYSSTSKVRIHW